MLIYHISINQLMSTLAVCGCLQKGRQLFWFKVHPCLILWYKSQAPNLIIIVKQIKATCLSLLNIVKLNKSCVLLVKQNLNTDYIAIHTYIDRKEICAVKLCTLEGGKYKIRHHRIPNVVLTRSPNWKWLPCTVENYCKCAVFVDWKVNSQFPSPEI